MSESQIREATPQEVEIYRKRQVIMFNHGLNVKIDGNWGPWQQEQWETNKFRLEEYDEIIDFNNLIKSKRIECWTGICFLVPAILGVISFICSLFDSNSDFATLRNLRGDWTDGDNRSSPAPIFMGLMAIAGAVLIKDSMKYMFVNKKRVC